MSDNSENLTVYNLPGLIAYAAKQLTETAQALKYQRERVADIRRRHLIDVLSATIKGANGNDKPAYPNEAARDAAVETRLICDQEYIDARAVESSLEIDRANTEARLEYLRNVLRIQRIDHEAEH